MGWELIITIVSSSSLTQYVRSPGCSSSLTLSVIAPEFPNCMLLKRGVSRWSRLPKSDAMNGALPDVRAGQRLSSPTRDRWCCRGRRCACRSGYGGGLPTSSFIWRRTRWAWLSVYRYSRVTLVLGIIIVLGIINTRSIMYITYIILMDVGRKSNSILYDTAY